MICWPKQYWSGKRKSLQHHQRRHAGAGSGRWLPGRELRYPAFGWRNFSKGLLVIFVPDGRDLTGRHFSAAFQDDDHFGAIKFCFVDGCVNLSSFR